MWSETSIKSFPNSSRHSKVSGRVFPTRRSRQAQLLIFLLIPLIVGVALDTYASYNGSCAYPCGVIHPYRGYGEVLIVATLVAYGTALALMRRARVKAASKSKTGGAEHTEIEQT
jgi:hypothetical protein